MRVNPESGTSVIVGAGSSFGAAIPSNNANTLASFAVVDDSVVSLSRSRDAQQDSSLFFALLPEKCSFVATSLSTLLCAVSTEEVVAPALTLSAWYAGFTIDSNELWFIDLARGARTLMLGREDMADLRFDMVEVASDKSQRFALFTDRQSRTLWAVRQ